PARRAVPQRLDNALFPREESRAEAARPAVGANAPAVVTPAFHAPPPRDRPLALARRGRMTFLLLRRIGRRRGLRHRRSGGQIRRLRMQFGETLFDLGHLVDELFLDLLA